MTDDSVVGNDPVVSDNQGPSGDSAVSDDQGGVSGYQVMVGTTPGGSDVFNGLVAGTSLTVTNNFGAHLYATVAAVNDAGMQGTAVSVSMAALKTTAISKLMLLPRSAAANSRITVVVTSRPEMVPSAIE